MAESVRKKARIVEVTESTLVLEMCSQEACSMCAAKVLCGQDLEQKTRRIELFNDGLNRKVGDEVSLLISSIIGLKAAFWFYGVPVFLIILSIVPLRDVITDNFILGVISLALLSVYYFMLWLFRNKIEKQISITIE